MDNEEVIKLAEDLAEFHNTTVKKELANMGFTEELKPINLGSLEAARGLGLIVK